MMKTKLPYLSKFLSAVTCWMAFGFLANPSDANAQLNVTVKNTLDFERSEVIAINVKKLSKLLKVAPASQIRIREAGQTSNLILQWIDEDNDGKPEELLFKPTLKANATTNYVVLVDGTTPLTESNVITYSRFVPERTDDYAWENDKVAFRTYGPDAQMRVEKKMSNGTLSSGIDLWLKRTELPVINEWYKGYLTDPNYYHKDNGKGYDPYHVGASRGTGGTGVWEGDTLLVSKNFTSYKTIVTGPLRAVFELDYAPYSRYNVKETKRISLDLGSNFSKFEVFYTSSEKLPNYTMGITLHDKKGQVNVLKDQGLFIHHETMDNTYLGEAIIVNPKIVKQAFANKSKVRDQSNLLVLTKPKKSTVFYAGFAWAKSGQVKDSNDWESFVKKQKKIIDSPLQIVIK
ncbi:MAG: DUF4861 domain-containing protein [Flavobacteriales bacterium]|nr:MAG: DUF4861 domain-containing protein [Flavobacteriales bacterium]